MSRDGLASKGQPPPAPPAAPVQNHPVLRPHRKLFFWSCVAYVVWMIALLVLYFETVYPLRHPSPGTRPGASDLPSAPR
jgi:hypothetical protein